VKGDSMIKAGILDGDFVIVTPQPELKNGDIIVALVNDEATVKRYKNSNGEILLIPENDNYQPIEVKNYSSFSVAGKVKGIIRYFN
jgi:repressor LexA